jgi:hypothetical protein
MAPYLMLPPVFWPILVWKVAILIHVEDEDEVLDKEDKVDWYIQDDGRSECMLFLLLQRPFVEKWKWTPLPGFSVPFPMVQFGESLR